jgi:hypothetical protein
MPEKVRMKASPSIYMPLGDPLGDQLGALTDGLGKLTDLEIGSGGDSLIYDYQGPEYGEARVIMAAMKNLTEQSFDDLAEFIDTLVNNPYLFDTLPDPAPFPKLPVPGAPDLPSSAGSDDGIDLSALLGSGGVLADYPGLKFRSVPAYLYIDGPARLFQDGNISIDLQFTDTAGAALMPPEHIIVSPVEFPNLPESGVAVSALSPRSPVLIELKDIFNADPQPEGLKADITFNIGEILIPKNELAAFAADLRTPLTAHLILLLPFQFTTSVPIPVFAGPDWGDSPPEGSPPNPAMELIPGGGDLLGRGGDDEDGTMSDIVKNLKSLSVEASVTNNLGINGYVKMLAAMPTTASPDPRELEGSITLSGTSTLTILKSDLETPPFSPALAIYLEGDFDIKRSLPPEGAMAMSMAIILRTNVDMTF